MTKCVSGSAGSTGSAWSWLALACVFAMTLQDADAVYFSVLNKCSYAVWINQEANYAVKPLNDSRVIKLTNGQSYRYNIPTTGWGGRLWPKTGCDNNGYNCEFGDATPPCPPTGCTPPADTKAEFYFGTGSDDSYYDISLVDGYTLPMKIEPIGNVGGSCVTTNCAMSLDACPKSELVGSSLDGTKLGDHRVYKNGKVVACLAPCKRWNYPSPYGLGKPENIYPGNYLCCPTPPIYPLECRSGLVVNTTYVKVIHKLCPSAYSYSYDDEGGLHQCPNTTSFAITICP